MLFRSHNNIRRSNFTKIKRSPLATGQRAKISTTPEGPAEARSRTLRGSRDKTNTASRSTPAVAAARRTKAVLAKDMVWLSAPGAERAGRVGSIEALGAGSLSLVLLGISMTEGSAAGKAASELGNDAADGSGAGSSSEATKVVSVTGGAIDKIGRAHV